MPLGPETAAMTQEQEDEPFKYNKKHERCSDAAMLKAKSHAAQKIVQAVTNISVRLFGDLSPLLLCIAKFLCFC